jgi:TolB-like protein/tetratricopeptide (TPR) repeat protein
MPRGGAVATTEGSQNKTAGTPGTARYLYNETRSYFTMADVDHSDISMNSSKESVLSPMVRDLKRRKVFRVIAAYGVIAWLLIEVSSVVLPALRAPDWTVTAVVVAAMAGFPITLLLAWVFDLTPRGVVRTAPAPERASEVHKVARVGIDLIVIGVLLAIIAYLVAQQGIFGPQGAGQQSIAVLPFVDVSEAGDNEYFSDGISEELLNSLVGIDGLRVAARTSSFAFKGRQEDVRAIGEKLNVQTVLEGSVRRAGDQVRITANLIDVNDGFPIWSATYNRRLDDIFAIQDEIARSIVEALRLELVGVSPGVRGVAATQDIKAYDLYLLGRHHWHERTPASLRRALDLFQQAVKTDPGFALAYTGLADTYLLLDGYGDMESSEAVAKAEPAVARALALDEDLAEAYASLGLLRFNQGDSTAAELALRSAINLNPNYSMAHMWLGLVLDQTTGPLASMEEYRRARQVDPLHPVVNRNLARAYASTGRYDDAERVLMAVRDVERGDSALIFELSQLHRSYGRLDEAARWAFWGTQEASDGVSELALALTMISLGDFERAEDFLNRAEGMIGDKMNVAAARMNLFLAQGRFDEIKGIAGSLRADSGQEKEKVGALMWRGIADIAAGEPATGTALLEESLAALGEFGMSPEDRLGVLAMLALGYRELGDETRSAEVLIRAAQEARSARDAGWNTPGLSAWEAVVHYMDNRFDEARARIQTAMEQGWRDYIPLAQFPPAGEFLSQPEINVAMEPLRDEVAAMGDAVRDLENLPAPPDKIKMVGNSR